MPRPIGQKGILRQRDSAKGRVWYCRFRLPRDAEKKRKDAHIMLGLVATMTEAQASEQMAILVARVNSEQVIAKQFGMPSALRSLQAPKRMEPPARAAIHGIAGHVGAMSELLVCTDLMAKGKEVFRALNPHASCDLICLTGDSFVRVEVKTSQKQKNGKIRPMALNSKMDKYDILAVVHPDFGSIDYIPYAAIPASGIAYFKTESSENPEVTLLATE